MSTAFKNAFKLLKTGSTVTSSTRSQASQLTLQNLCIKWEWVGQKPRLAHFAHCLYVSMQAEMTKTIGKKIKLLLNNKPVSLINCVGVIIIIILMESYKASVSATKRGSWRSHMIKNKNKNSSKESAMSVLTRKRTTCISQKSRTRLIPVINYSE